MAEDIDDLLDEVESKFVKDKSKEIRSSKSKPTRRKAEDDEMDQIIDDICGDTEPLKMCNIPKEASSSTNQKQSLASKCFPLYVGGSVCSEGFGNSFNKRTCDKLRCTSCDFRVVSFNDFEWHKSTDYLFLRNNVPDFDRLKSKLRMRKGCRAYCCQCTSLAVAQLTDLKNEPVKWVCGKH